jgi:hypothetical protein
MSALKGEILLLPAIGEEISHEGLYKCMQWKMTISAPTGKHA